MKDKHGHVLVERPTRLVYPRRVPDSRRYQQASATAPPSQPFRDLDRTQKDTESILNTGPIHMARANS